MWRNLIIQLCQLSIHEAAGEALNREFSGAAFIAETAVATFRDKGHIIFVTGGAGLIHKQIRERFLSAQGANWYKRYRELSYLSRWGIGIYQVDKKYDRKALNPEELALLKLRTLEKNLTEMQELLTRESIENRYSNMSKIN